MKYLFFLSLFLVLASCADLKRPKQIERIENITKELSSSKKQFHTIDEEELKDIFHSSRVIDQRIKQFYSGDTISVDFAKKLEAFHFLIQDVKKLNEFLQKVDSSIVERENKLSLLLKDVKNGAGKRSKYGEYIDFEEREVEKVIDIVNFCDSSANEIIETFNILHPKIEKFSLQCEEKFNLQQEYK